MPLSRILLDLLDHGGYQGEINIVSDFDLPSQTKLLKDLSEAEVPTYNYEIRSAFLLRGLFKSDLKSSAISDPLGRDNLRISYPNLALSTVVTHQTLLGIGCQRIRWGEGST